MQVANSYEEQIRNLRETSSCIDMQKFCVMLSTHQLYIDDGARGVSEFVRLNDKNKKYPSGQAQTVSN